MVIEGHVVIDIDAAWLPFGELVARARQGRERRPIELLKERTSTDAGDLHRAVVDRVDPLANGGVQIGEGEKRAMSQGREDPALGDLDTHLDFGFVGWRGDARGNDDRAIVARQIGVRPVDLRFVATDHRDAALQIVRDPDRRTALTVIEHADVRADPRRQVLRAGGFGVDQAAGAEHADEEFDGNRLTRRRIDEVGPLA